MIEAEVDYRVAIAALAGVPLIPSYLIPSYLA